MDQVITISKYCSKVEFHYAGQIWMEETHVVFSWSLFGGMHEHNDDADDSNALETGRTWKSFYYDQ